MPNLFADIPQSLPIELYTDLLNSNDVRIERIVSHGHASTANRWYDQPEDVFVMVLKGAAKLTCEEGTVELASGDFLNIPAGKKHRIDWTTPDQPTVWLAVHYRIPDKSQQNVVKSPGHLFSNLPRNLPAEFSSSLVESEGVRIETIVSHGHASPAGFWYDQDQHEWALVLTGAAKLQFPDCVAELKPGDFINIPAHHRHRVEWTLPEELTIWLAVFYDE